MSSNRILPERDLRDRLLRVQMPGRYVGGEWGCVRKEGDGYLNVAVSYPDMYEIGMSNLAVQILYRRLNALEGVRCERVFAAGPDFEAELRTAGLPLYTLETGIPLHAVDVLGFSVGYELTLTNVLAMLDLGGIPLHAADRRNGDPIVLAGGPAVTNPAPLGRFVDAIFIGEVEGWCERVFAEMAGAKQNGAGRDDLLKILGDEGHIWVRGSKETARRAVWPGFGQNALAGPPPPPRIGFPVPSIKTVQDHGVVEIMRGCAQGCRFCHAGILYRPFRVKGGADIVAEADELVWGCGYREITLSSLSSGDYPDLPGLVEVLNSRYASLGVSFAVPSLRVSSVALDLLAKLSAVRKSGLTFAVETPTEAGQRSINKRVDLGRTVELLREARERGWRRAKFYFMVGLPASFEEDESAAVLDFIGEVRDATRLELNVNVACFIPKPHTPFQWAPQLNEETGLDRIMAIKRGAPRGVRVSYHSPFLSVLEGAISRGDERAAELVEEAYSGGARLDAWEEHVQRDLWRKVFAGAGWDVEAEVCRERSPEEPLPWRSVDLGVSRAFLRREHRRAEAGEITPPCSRACAEECGACTTDVRVRDDPAVSAPPPPAVTPVDRSQSTRIAFTFSKHGSAAYLSHLNILLVMSRALIRAGWEARLTEGHNPKPRLEFANPLPLGVESDQEISAVQLWGRVDVQRFVESLNRVLPDGIRVAEAVVETPLPGIKRRSVMARFWGGVYEVIDAPAALGEAMAEPGVFEPYLKVSTKGDDLVFQLRQSGPQTRGVPRMLAELGYADVAGLRIRRTRSLLIGAGGEPAEFGEAFDSDAGAGES